MNANARKLKLHLLILIVFPFASMLWPRSAYADIPKKVHCFEDICISIIDSETIPIKDYYYVSRGSRRSAMFRFRNGAIIQMVFDAGSSGQCQSETISLASTKANFAIGNGCVVATTKSGTQYFSVSVVASTHGLKPDSLIRRTVPVFWTTGFDKHGKYISNTSPLVPIVMQKIKPENPKR